MNGLLRRIVDVLVSGSALIATSPVMVVTAILIRWRMGKPVLFRQRRSGLNGQPFEIIKFRTMHVARGPSEDDSVRSTNLGLALRSASLDELPQFWNILKGDMSLIGPRPTLPEQVVRYTERQRGRLLVRPGLTGWAQVNGRNSISWPERIDLDLWYVAHRSLWLDLRIIRKTVGQLLRRRGITGSGGVNEGFPVPRVVAPSVENAFAPPDLEGPDDQAQTGR